MQQRNLLKLSENFQNIHRILKIWNHILVIILTDGYRCMQIRQRRLRAKWNILQLWKFKNEGREWNHKTIRGNAQGDWNEIYYPVDEWDEKSLDEFETMYFNEGSEWCIHDGNEEPQAPEDIEGYWMYCCSWDEVGIRREIANACGVPENEVVMYKYAGELREDVYELAS